MIAIKLVVENEDDQTYWMLYNQENLFLYGISENCWVISQ